MRDTPMSRVQVLELPIVHDDRGNLTSIEADEHVPFGIKRVYYLYDVPGGSERGAHAHKDLHQVVIAMSGSFDIHLDDGHEKRTFHLNRSYHGLYIPPLVWRSIDNFSSGSVLMVLASEKFTEDDYFRSYDEFMAEVWKR